MLPFISDGTIKADNIPALIRAAVRKGVTVSIYADDRLNTTGNGTTKSAAHKGVNDIANAGAMVYIFSGINHKALIKDEDLIAEGSFNWLSAARDNGGVSQREERSLVICGGTKTAEMINMTQKN
ncbi:MAG: hypothetical protein AB7U43_09905 [Desulfobacter sp.]